MLLGKPLLKAIQAKHEEKGQGQSPKNQHILLAWCQGIDAKPIAEILLEAGGGSLGTDILKGIFACAAYGTTPISRKIAKQGIGCHLLTAISRTRFIHVPARSTFIAIPGRCIYRLRGHDSHLAVPGLFSLKYTLQIMT